MRWIPTTNTTKTPMTQTKSCYSRRGRWVIAALFLLTIGCEDAAQIGDPVEHGEGGEPSACTEQPAPSFEPTTGFPALDAFTEPDEVFKTAAKLIEVRADAIRVETMEGVVETFRWEGADLRSHFQTGESVQLLIAYGIREGREIRLAGMTKARSDERSGAQMMMVWMRSEELAEPLVLPLPAATPAGLDGTPVDGDATSPSLRFDSLVASASCVATAVCGETTRTTEDYEIFVDLAEGATVAPGMQVVVDGWEFNHVRAKIRRDTSDDGACEGSGLQVLEATLFSST